MSTSSVDQADFEAYPQAGYVWPLRAFHESKADLYRTRFMKYWNENIYRFEGKLPRERQTLTIDTHLALPWVCEMAMTDTVLDAVEKVIGPDILIWNTHWFPKFPGDRGYISWHQDATYWGLQPPLVTTAWIALTPSNNANGCLRVLPGSHQGDLLPQNETYAEDNMLSRGQEIAVEIDENQAVSLELLPGQFSLHHIGIAHGSGPNTSTIPRIGLAIRYIAAEVLQSGPYRDSAILARGADRYGHFELVEPPQREWTLDEEDSPQLISLRNKLDNIARNR